MPEALVVTTETLQKTPDVPVFTQLKAEDVVVKDDGQKKDPADQAPAEPPAEQKAETTDEQPEKPGKNRFERRLNKAYRKAAEAQGRADFLESELAKARQQSPQQKEPGEPRLEDYSDIKKYAEDFATWKTDTTLKKQEATRQAETAKTAQQRISAAWDEKVKLGDEKYDDFDDAVGDLKPTTPWALAIMSAENAHDVAYYYGTHEEEAKRLIEMDPISQVREVGKTEAKLLLQPPTPKASSKAPAPIAPVTGTSSGASDIWDKDTDMKTFMKKRQKQVHGR